MKFAFLLYFVFNFLVLAQSPLSKSETTPVLPHAMTVLEIAKQEKLTAGDLIVLEVTPFNQAQDAVPEVLQKEAKLPIEWGEGRILWYKPFDAATGKIRIGLTTYVPGNFEIKPIVFVKKNSGEKLFISDSKTVPFEKIEGDKKKDDIFPPISIEIPQWMILLLSILFLVATLLVLRAVHKVRKKKKMLDLQMAQAIELSPIEEYEKQRQAIEAKSYLDRAQFKQHYFALSEAFKKFLGRAYHFDAQDKTTRELNEAMREAGISAPQVERCLKIMSEMDVVKFTDKQPTKEEAIAVTQDMSLAALSFWNASPEALEIREIERKKRAL